MKAKYPYLLPILLSTIVLLSGCGQKTTPLSNTSAQLVISACFQACQDAQASGKDLAAGPCLQDPMPVNQNWVCDVAHNPRQLVDNLSENQCQAYRNGTAHYFVEVTPDCQLIQTK